MIYDDYVRYTNEYKIKYGEQTIVFIEIGSFFEIYGVFNEKETSGANMIEIGNLLNIQVSRKNKAIIENSRENPMMAGFPNHALQKFIDVLISNKYTIVLIEQVTPPPNPKREVTQVISPSTYTSNISSNTTNILMIMYIEPIQHWKTKQLSYGIGIGTVDLSTSRTSVYEKYVDKHMLNEEIVRLCIHYNPKELVISSKEFVDVFVPSNIHYHDKISKIESQFLNKDFQNKALTKVFKSTGSLQPIEYVNLETKHLSLVAFVYLLDFVYSHNELLLQNISKPTIDEDDNKLILNNNALYQLDIIGKTNSLTDILNNCVTAIGRRYFTNMITSPSQSVETIKIMYENNEFYKQDNLYSEVREVLKQIMDIERIVRKTNVSPAQITTIYTSLIETHKLYKLIKKENNLVDVLTEIESSLIIDKAAKYNLNNIDENIFCVNYNTDLDKLQNKINKVVEYFEREYRRDGFMELVKMERSEKDGIIFTTTPKKFTELNKLFDNKYSSIKYKQNHVRVFNKEIESKNIEYQRIKTSLRTMVTEVFVEYTKKFIETYGMEITDIIHDIEMIDFHSTNVYNAIRFGYTKPVILDKYDSKSFINAKQIRHPIIEYVQRDTKYVPNDIELDDSNRGIVLYGINASGKSSLMKSLGINIVMAQAGMYVPCKSFEFYPYANVYTRILNNDNLYKKQSTFTVEMSELRNILNNCSNNSLVIGDELCSGTESISAISLVSAGIIHLSRRESSFIFATHLHELDNIEELKELDNVCVKHLSVKYDVDTNDIIYDRILKNGSGNTLYGLEVCKSLDLDKNFLETANKIRKSLLSQSQNISSNHRSHFNKSLIKDECYICNRKADEVHHIEEQRNADENNMIGHYKKNSLFNLVPLCSECHDKTHYGKLKISGFVDTVNNGKKLVYSA